MRLLVTAGDDPTRAILKLGNKDYRCAIGAGGMRSDKQEGDKASPIGCFPLRRLFYRPDRLADAPETKLPVETLNPDMGWSDDAGDPDHYNRLVPLPYTPSHEKLWRSDPVYDVIVEVGYNDAPPVPGLGSAIFMHVARGNYTPTEGCAALALPDLLEVVSECAVGDEIEFRPA